MADAKKSKKASSKTGKAKKAGSTPAKPKQLTLAKAAHATFKPHTGTEFQILCFAGAEEDGTLHEGVQVPCKLVSCEEKGPKRKLALPEHAEGVMRKSFHLVFQGPDGFPFQDALVDISHPELGELKGVHVTADVSEDGTKSYLSAIFN